MDQYVFLTIMKVTPKTAKKTIHASFPLRSPERADFLPDKKGFPSDFP